MKKFIALLMAALLVFAFAGCGDTNTTVEDPSEEASQADAATEEAATQKLDLDVEPVTGLDELAEDSDLAKIISKGTLVVGITDYAPMDYKDPGSDEWTGFDAEFAEAFAEAIGVKVEFIEVDWDNKFFELESNKIDCIWNGMTITDEVTLNTNCSAAYVKNAQVVVMAADKVADYADAESMKDLTFAVESGSAGEAAAKDNGFNYTSVLTQADALMEVQAGTADACIIDITMANAMTGAGTSYEKLAAGLELTSEEYGVGFRKGSDATAVLDAFMKAQRENVLVPLAAKYELTLAF